MDSNLYIIEKQGTVFHILKYVLPSPILHYGDFYVKTATAKSYADAKDIVKALNSCYSLDFSEEV